MSWKQIKPDASGVLTLFVAGAGMLLLTFLSFPGDHIPLGRSLPTVNRAAHPVLFWACEILMTLAGVFFLVFGACLLRTLIRRQRDQVRNLEQEAVDSFVRDHQRTEEKSTLDKNRSS